SSALCPSARSPELLRPKLPAGRLQLQFPHARLEIVPRFVGLLFHPTYPFGCRPVGRVPWNGAADRLLYVGRPEQLGPNVLAEVLRFGVLGARSVAKEDSFVKLLVDEMVVDRLGTLGAANRIHFEPAAVILRTDDIGD